MAVSVNLTLKGNHFSAQQEVSVGTTIHSDAPDSHRPSLASGSLGRTQVGTTVCQPGSSFERASLQSLWLSRSSSLCPSSPSQQIRCMEMRFTWAGVRPALTHNYHAIIETVCLVTTAQAGFPESLQRACWVTSHLAQRSLRCWLLSGSFHSPSRGSLSTESHFYHDQWCLGTKLTNHLISFLNNGVASRSVVLWLPFYEHSRT